MAKQLDGKIITITGAASGIGLATAKECAARGASLALSDLNIDALNTLVKDLQSQHPDIKVSATQLNVTDSSAVDAWITAVIKDFGRIDGAANIAGVESKPGSKPYTSIVDMTDEHWKFVIDVNLNGVFYCLRALLKVMESGGSIVNAASTAGVRGAANFSAYTASKHGVVGLTKSASKEGKGVRVNAICPGPVDTVLLRRMLEGQTEFLDSLANDTPLKRLGQTEEIARTFCFLLSDDSSWTNGTTIVCDGGTVKG